MSKISLEPNASGAGTFTLAAPNSNTNRTLNLPDESGVLFSDGSGVPGSAVTGQLASSNMPAGSVIQVVQATSSTSVTQTSTSFTSTGLTATITPKFSSSKIYVLAHQQSELSREARSQGVGYRIERNSTVVQTFNNSVDGHFRFDVNVGSINNVQISSVVPLSFLDTPASTAPVTYEVFAIIRHSGDVGSVRHQRNGSPSTITLMEIAE